VAVALSCKVLHEFRPAGDASENALLVRVEAGGAPQPRRVPILLAILLDTSGSMEGSPLEAALAGTADVLGVLGTSDYATVLGFDDKARILTPLQRLERPEHLIDDLRRTKAGGATRLAVGLDRALDQLASPHPERCIRRLLLLSDGQPSHGPRKLGELGDLLGRAAELGVSISTVGLGLEFDEELLAGLAAATGGRYVPVGVDARVGDALVGAVGIMDRAAFADAKLRVEPLRWNTLHDGAETLEIPLPDLPSGTWFEALVPIDHEPRAPGDYVVATVRAEGLDPATGRARLLQAEALARFQPGAEGTAKDAEEVRAASMARGGEAVLVRTMGDLRAGEIGVADVPQRLEGAAAAFRAGGREDLAEATAALAARVADGRVPDPNKWLAAIVLDVRTGQAS
jgi:hypothetical protein